MACHLQELNRLVQKHLEHACSVTDIERQFPESLYTWQGGDDSELCKLFRSVKQGNMKDAISHTNADGIDGTDSLADELHNLLLEHLHKCSANADFLEHLRGELYGLKSAECSELYKVFRYAKVGELQVAVSGLSGQLFILNSTTFATVCDLKLAIEARLDIPPNQQRLVHDGIELENSHALSSYKISPWSPSVTLVRVPATRLYAAGGFGASGCTFASAEVYDPDVKYWTPLPAMTTARNMLAAVVMKGRLYALGGFDAVKGRSLASGEVYEPHLGAWSPLPDMLFWRGGLGAATMNDKLYAVGGTHEPGQGLANAEVFDPSLKLWKLLPEMAARRSRLAAAAADGKLYAVGGFDHVSGLALESVEVFDANTEAWAPLPDMARSRGMLAAVVVHGKLFAIGGYDPPDALASAEVFDPMIGTWTSLPSMESRRAGLAAAVVANKVYVFGGGSALASGWGFDPSLGCWEPLPCMASGRAGLAVAAG